MTEFDMRQFIALLQIAPEEKPMVETPEHSEYLQKNIFDVLKKDGSVDLKHLDWSAFEMKDLRSSGHANWLNTTPSGWLHGINFLCIRHRERLLGGRNFFRRTPHVRLRV